MAAGIAATLYTIGHGAATLDAFAGWLEAAGIARIVDVRRYPASRRHPQFNAAALAEALAARSIAYSHAEDLGGRRVPRPDSNNTGLRNDGFRGYADWMEQQPFAIALDVLLGGAARTPSAVMCAETPWWKCHRRLIADAAELLRGVPVIHLMAGRASPHRATAGAHVTGPDRLRYLPSV